MDMERTLNFERASLAVEEQVLLLPRDFVVRGARA